MELTWNNAMEPNDSLTENESSTRIEEDFLVMSSSELQYYPQQYCQCQGHIVHWQQWLW